MNSSKLAVTAKHIRKQIIEMLVPYESHHIGCSLDMVEILTVLYYDILRIDPTNPGDPLRDIFILSKGHGGAALYATLAHRGFFHKDLLSGYDTDGGLLPEHATAVVPGIEFSAGSLGHGLPVAIGFAISLQHDGSDRRVYCLISDGELDEGSNWEAILFGGHHKLGNLTVIVDYNHFQGYGTIEETMGLEPLSDKFKAFHWGTHHVDGHNLSDLSKLLQSLKKRNHISPQIVFAHTIKGKGISFFEGKFESHYKSIDPETKAMILQELE